MKLTKIARVPFPLEVGDELWAVPKMTLGDFVTFAAQLDAQFVEQATRGMTPEQRFQHLVFIGVAPLNLGAIRRMSMSPGGIRHVLTTCLSKAMVTATRKGPEAPWETLPERKEVNKDSIPELIEYGEPQEQEALVRILADNPEPTSTPPAAGADAGQGDKQRSDPSGKSKKPTLEIGDSTSPSSTPSTPALIR